MALHWRPARNIPEPGKGGNRGRIGDCGLGLRLQESGAGCNTDPTQRAASAADGASHSTGDIGSSALGY
jgi:hypothetical protein